MPKPDRERTTRGKLHPRNPHQGRYDFESLCAAAPDLARFLRPHPVDGETLDFADPAAVLTLNRAILAHAYQIEHWTIPDGYLCPPVPGRADYVHYAADLLAGPDGIPTGKGVRVLDVGTGANCIYPIIGSQSYGWKFVATDIDPVSIKSARLICEANPRLRKLVRVVQQKQRDAVFASILRPTDRFHLVMCNPPFHASMEEAEASTLRKHRNLGTDDAANSMRNFGGQPSELWCPGGELAFVTAMIRESVRYATQVDWFTSLVSKGGNLRALQDVLRGCEATEVRVIPMSQGSKISRILAWKM